MLLHHRKFRVDKAAINESLLEVIKVTRLEGLIPFFDLGPKPETVSQSDHIRFKELEGLLTQFLRFLIDYKDDPKRSSKSKDAALPKMTISEFSDLYVKLKTEHPSPQSPETQPPSPVEPFSPDVMELLLEYCTMYFATCDYSRCARWLDLFCFACEFLKDIPLKTQARGSWGMLAALDMRVAISVKKGADGALQIQAVDSFDDVTEPEAAAFSSVAACVLRLDALLDEAAYCTQFTARDILRQRLCLLHWALWGVLRYYLASLQQPAPFERKARWEEVVEWILLDRHLSLARTLAPHLLRYYSALVICLQDEVKLKHVVEAISTSVLAASATQPSELEDPLSQFLEYLVSDAAFDRARILIPRAAEFARRDYMMALVSGAVETNIQFMYFEACCRVHRRVDMTRVSNELRVDVEQVERWIIALVRHSKLNAKIDSENNCVEITGIVPSIYHTILEKSRVVTARSAGALQALAASAGK
eukprot:Polyplicarium_translucidae@DN1263_c0_g1_i1.p1